MEQSMRFDDVELIALADRLVELTEEVRVARVRTVHRLELEAEIVSGCFRIEGALHRYRSLIQEGGIGFIRKELAKIRDGGIIRIARSTHFHEAGYGHCVPPRGHRGRFFSLQRDIRSVGGRHGGECDYRGCDDLLHCSPSNPERLNAHQSCFEAEPSRPRPTPY